MYAFEYQSLVQSNLRQERRHTKQTTTDVGKQDPADHGATGRTATNSHGRSMPYLPFGMPSISFEPHHNSSKATSGLMLP